MGNKWLGVATVAVIGAAIAALVGGIFLGQALGTRMMIAVFCVTIAALGITLTEKHDGQ